MAPVNPLSILSIELFGAECLQNKLLETDACPKFITRNFIISPSFYKPHCKCQFYHPMSISYHLNSFNISKAAVTTKNLFIILCHSCKISPWSVGELILNGSNDYIRNWVKLTGLTPLSITFFNITWTFHEPIQFSNSTESCPTRARKVWANLLQARQAQQPWESSQH